MKLTHIIVLGTSLLSLCRADDRDLRGGRGKGGRGGGRGNKKKGLLAGRANCYWAGEEGNSKPFLERLQKECDNTNYECGTSDNVDCTNWETVNDEDIMLKGCRDELSEEQKAKMQAKREEWKLMTDGERADIKAKREKVKAANAATLLECGCCDDKEGVAGLVQGKEGLAAKTLGFGKPRGEGGHGFGSGHGGGGRPGGHGYAGSEFGDGSFTCPEDEVTEAKCDQLGTRGFECNPSTSMMRGRQFGYMFYCECCEEAEAEEEGSNQGGD